MRQIIQLSTLTAKNRRKFKEPHSAMQKDQSRVIFSPKEHGTLKPVFQETAPNHITCLSIGLNLKNMTTPEENTMPLPSKQSTAGLSPKALDLLGRPNQIPAIDPEVL